MRKEGSTKIVNFMTQVLYCIIAFYCLIGANLDDAIATYLALYGFRVSSISLFSDSKSHQSQQAEWKNTVKIFHEQWNGFKQICLIRIKCFLQIYKNDRSDSSQIHWID